ncbi:hypothetical protein HID58_093879 [Brassica napus]|uniref:Uncharacterized protein n=1 Tax=Brassica napus TaxID=3708 RepID=A0ABQ7X9H1_BRANA|nr:hypothetical protein HID58_093879 [Brassica napus]
MSRVFPFPHPGYVLNGSEALIESIKRAEEKAKKRTTKKERKRRKRIKRGRRGKARNTS